MANKKDEQNLTSGGETYEGEPAVEEDKIPVGGSVLLDRMYYTDNTKTMRIINNN